MGWSPDVANRSLSSERDTPVTFSTIAQRSAGMPLAAHFSTACREIALPDALVIRRASSDALPAASIALSYPVMMRASEPQVHDRRQPVVGALPLAACKPRLMTRKKHTNAESERGNTREPSDPELARRLVVLRDRARRSGQEVSDSVIAAATGTSPTGVGKWFKNGAVARQKLPDLCRTIQCSADELLGLVAIGENPLPPLDLDRLTEALTFIEMRGRLAKVKYTPREKAQILLDVLNSSPGEGE